MDILSWATIIFIILVIIFTFVILPKLQKINFKKPVKNNNKNTIINNEELSYNDPTDTDTILKENKIKDTIASCGLKKINPAVEDKVANEKLNKIYEDTQLKNIPLDHPVKPIGSCVEIKPYSTSLPLANTPMCFAVKEKNMKLEEMH